MLRELGGYVWIQIATASAKAPTRGTGPLRLALALLAWEALARDPLARLRRIQVESIGNDK